MLNKNCANFYGRRLGRLNTKAKDLLLNLLPIYSIDIEHIQNDSFLELIKPYYQINLEIGFGSGDFLLQSATLNPSELYVGVEVFQNGIANLLANLEEKPLTNLKIYPNSWYNICHLLPNQIFNTINILFPDPWIKTRHHKRRIINSNNLLIFDRCLQVGGMLRFASDILEYSKWVEDCLKSYSANKWQIKKYTYSSSENSYISKHIQTKYEKKALTSGRTITYIEAIKT